MTRPRDSRPSPRPPLNYARTRPPRPPRWWDFGVDAWIGIALVSLLVLAFVAIAISACSVQMVPPSDPPDGWPPPAGPQ